MKRKVFCDAYCEWEANGYKIEETDLSEFVESGTYVLGKNVTDKKKSGDSSVITEGATLIVNRNDTYVGYGINQMLINGTNIDSRLVYINRETGEFSSCTEWKTFDLQNLLSWNDVFIDTVEPDYKDGAIWFKPIE